MNRVLRGTVTGELLNLSDYIVNNCDVLESDNYQDTVVKWQDGIASPSLGACVELTVPITDPRPIGEVIASTLWINDDDGESSLRVSSRMEQDFLANDLNALHMLRLFRAYFTDYRANGRRLIVPYAPNSAPIVLEANNREVIPRFRLI